MKFYKLVFLILAEEEWIEEQLAVNPDFNPNDETTIVNNGTDEQQPESIINDATSQNGTSDNVEQTGEGTNADGENMEEPPPKPKRFVSSKNFYILY